jgi:hypothetical protein
LAYVTGLTNGRAAAQIKFKASGRRSGPRRLTWSSVDLVEGRKERSTFRRTVEIRYQNYLQFAGVRPGPNTLTVRLERLGGLAVESLTVLRDSGLEVTRLAPPRLTLEPVLPHHRVRAEDEFQVRFTLSNSGDRPARDVVVGLEQPVRGLRVRGRAVHRFASVRRRASRGFHLRATRPGRHRLTISAGAVNANRPAVEIAVPVGPPSRRVEPSHLVRNVTGVLLLIIGALLIVGFRLRART